MDKWLIILLLLEIILFAFVILSISVLRARGFLLSSFIVTAIIGCILFFLALRLQVAGWAKIFLLLAAAAPAAMPISAILHNLVSAGITKLRGGKESEEPVFFLLALFGCPAAFAVGVIGTIAVLIKSLFAG
jgi:hypothetical protein